MKTVIVLGTARSGTSMLAGMLHMIGVDMNQHSNPRQYGPGGNPKGSFEDANFNALTTKLWHNRPDADLSKEIEHLIKLRESRGNEIWGWKSALTHYVFERILPYITNPIFAAVFRDPLTNAYSWKDHMKKVYNRNVTLTEAIKEICGSNMALSEILLRHPNIPTFFTTYHIMYNSFTNEGRRLAKFLEIKLNARQIKQLENFVVRRR